MIESLEPRLQFVAGLNVQIFPSGSGSGPRPAGGLGSLRVWIDLDRDRKRDSVEPTGVTDEDGHYGFRQLRAKTYTVGIEDADYPVRYLSQHFLEGVAGEKNGGSYPTVAVAVIYDFPAENTLGGQVFFDKDQSRNTTDRLGEIDSGIAGVRVFMDLNRNGRREKSEPQTLTDANGNYYLHNFRYDQANAPIRCSTPEGFTATTPTKQIGDSLGFGFYQPRPNATIEADVVLAASLNQPQFSLDPPDPAVRVSHVRVYLDLDRDGKHDAKEPTAYTYSSARARFRNLRPGRYVVRLDTPAGYAPDRSSLEIEAADRQKRVQTFALGGTKHLKFGIYHDTNFNHRRDANEPYLTDLTRLYLTSADIGMRVVTGVTAKDSLFHPSALPPVAISLMYPTSSPTFRELPAEFLAGFADGDTVDVAV